MFDAAQAERLGLVNHVVPAAELGKVTRAPAEKIAGGLPGVLRLAKQMVSRAATSDLGAALGPEAYSQGLSTASDDHQEGRPPTFTGR